ncbi:MAG: membrane dipeptidase [Clostridia bacterium]|nr:membrane dipeptidase [Clostridia bacterium]
MHTDFPTAILRREKSAVNYSTKFDRQIITAAFFTPEKESEPYAYYKKMRRAFDEENTLPKNALDESRTVILSLENGSPFENDLNRIYHLSADGIKTVSLTWNGDNSLAGGAFGDGKLTPKGAEVIKILNREKMALDISHLNEKSAETAAKTADFLIASHSNANSVFPHPRNLSDDILKLIKEKNGLVGINFYPPFLGVGDVFSNIINHISYMLGLGLADNIALGSDFDGAEMDKALKNTDDVLILYDKLCDYFGDKRLIDKIFYQNAYDFYKKLFDN